MKYEFETSILPAKRSAAVQPYLAKQNNAFEPITELYLAILMHDVQQRVPKGNREKRRTK